MASRGPLEATVAHVVSRRKRAPRKLEYSKCAFCRKAKVKCNPMSDPQAKGKCLRCFQKKLACSTLRRAGETSNPRPAVNEVFSPDPIPEEVDRGSEVHDALAILSLQHILIQAFAELTAIGEQQLLPLKGSDAYDKHRSRLRVIEDYFFYDIEDFRDNLDRISGSTAKIVLRAAMDIAYMPSAPHFPRKFTTIISKYTEEGHDGVAYILRLRQIEECITPTDEDIQRMILARNRFISSIHDVLERQDIDTEFCSNLSKTQLSIPAVLFRLPAIVKAVQDDGRPDCLQRPVDHILHDSGVVGKFRVSATDPYNFDFLGRTNFHIAFAMAEHEHNLTAEWHNLKFNRFGLPPYEVVLGLNPFHIAAIHGHTYGFKLAMASGHNRGITFAISSSDTDRTCLHWAAYFGHLELTEFLLESYQTLERQVSQSLLCSTDWQDDTALHLAARNGHTDVVKSILKYTDLVKIRETCWRHTPFWTAVAGRHLDVMKLLATHSNIDELDKTGTRPLAEAARQGFFEGVEYLLLTAFGRVEVNSLNHDTVKAKEKQVVRTPLDFAIAGGHTKCIEILRKHGALAWHDQVARMYTWDPF